MPGPDIPYQAPRGCPDPLPHHLILRREVNFPMGQHAFFKNVFVSLPQTAVQAKAAPALAGETSVPSLMVAETHGANEAMPC